MYFLLKKLIFKFMELGLGLRPCFALETEDPIFINFKLTDEEAAKVKQDLPIGYALDRIRFSDKDTEPAYWLSYNFYRIHYPKPELAHLKKVRCEVNTFVTGPNGRKGIYVFLGSPFVSKDTGGGVYGRIADCAERLVIWIYGVGRLLGFEYVLSKSSLQVRLTEPSHQLDIDCPTRFSCTTTLSKDYILYNDISYFNSGRTFDLVNSNSSFALATFSQLEAHVRAASPYFNRTADSVLVHSGRIAYLVSALNRVDPAT